MPIDHKGLRNPNVKLSIADVLYIYDAKIPGRDLITQRQLAKQFKTTQPHISKIQRRLTWTEVLDEHRPTEP